MIATRACLARLPQALVGAPLEVTDAVAPPAPPGRGPDSRSSYNLVADVGTAIRGVVHDILTSDGYAVALASNGQEAVIRR